MRMKRFFENEDGVTVIEYALIAATIGMVIVLAFPPAVHPLKRAYLFIIDSLNKAIS